MLKNRGKWSRFHKRNWIATKICRYFVQVKLVRVAGQGGEQVYIQIGDDEMEMLTQQQAEQVSSAVSCCCNLQ